RAIELGPSVVQTYLAKANALLAAGRDSEALEALEAANRCDPQNAEIQIELGDVCLLNLRRTKDALAHYETALKLNPVLVPVYVRLADLHMHLGRSKDAQTDLETLRKISPRMPDLVALEARLRKLANP
ncbi:MAG TPA: tetratricopeptide repeat protein, partial [Haliangiales bacterium]|nr:tetratricopeptide repeat protein [Haliangiales bacterium]